MFEYNQLYALSLSDALSTRFDKIIKTKEPDGHAVLKGTTAGPCVTGSTAHVYRAVRAEAAT